MRRSAGAGMRWLMRRSLAGHGGRLVRLGCRRCSGAAWCDLDTPPPHVDAPGHPMARSGGGVVI